MRFVAALAFVGMLLSGLMIQATWLSGAHAARLAIGLFVGVFVTFVPAIATHPAAESRGGSTSVGWRDVMRTAPPWVNAVVVLTWGLFIVVFAVTYAQHGALEFSVDEASLDGHPERVRFLGAFFAAIYAAAFQTAASGMRWRARWTAGNVP